MMSRSYAPSETTIAPRIARSDKLDGEVLRALPEREATNLGEALVPLDDRCEVIARELPHLAREKARPVGEEDLHLGDAAGIHEHLPRRGMAGVVLEVNPQALLAHRHPRRLAAP